MERTKKIGLIVYILFLMIPIYWLINLSLQPNRDIMGSFSLYPQNLTFDNYRRIFTEAGWARGYLNSLIYVLMNTVISITVALPAAYAFSRYKFIGDKHLFFWLLTNRMAPPAVFLLPPPRQSASSTCISRSRWRIVCSRSRWRSGFSKGSCPACPRK